MNESNGWAQEFRRKFGRGVTPGRCGVLPRITAFGARSLSLTDSRFRDLSLETCGWDPQYFRQLSLIHAEWQGMEGNDRILADFRAPNRKHLMPEGRDLPRVFSTVTTSCGSRAKWAQRKQGVRQNQLGPLFRKPNGFFSSQSTGKNAAMGEGARLGNGKDWPGRHTHKQVGHSNRIYDVLLTTALTPKHWSTGSVSSYKKT